MQRWLSWGKLRALSIYQKLYEWKARLRQSEIVELQFFSLHWFFFRKLVRTSRSSENADLAGVGCGRAPAPRHVNRHVRPHPRRRPKVPVWINPLRERQ